MSDFIKDIINDIALKHEVTLGRNDPILIMQTINTRLMEDSAKAQQLMLDQYKEELEGIALRWGADAKEKSERILNASLAAAKETMANVLQESAKTTALTIQNNIEKLLSRADESQRRTERIAMMNLIASAITLMAAATVVLGFFK